MIISKAQFLAAAVQVRVLEGQLDAQMSQLRDQRLWTGPDAERYFAEWESEVRQRLRNAARLLETMVVVPF